MNAFAPNQFDLAKCVAVREWLASIALGYQLRRNKSALATVEHTGPLRVQRPFYPEADGTCHTYLLHPPGGMAVGDQLSIRAELEPGTRVLLTTPSAGKMYGTKGVADAESMPQMQKVSLHLNGQSQCEWLPQETIIFNSARAELNTQIHLSAEAKFIGWDIVRLGRAASGEQFTQGHCYQRLQCFRDNKLIFREFNSIEAGSALMGAKWGLQGANTLATLLATVELTREQIDELYTLVQRGSDQAWGLTQKNDLFIARYLGRSILDCRSGLQRIWQYLRPYALGKPASIPRIWNT